MIKTIIEKEIKQNLTSYKFFIITLLFVVSVSASLFIMYQDFMLRTDNYETLMPDENEPVAIVAPTPMSVFVRGLDDTIGSSYRITFGGQIEVGTSQQSANMLFRFFTNPDMLFIIKTIISLGALLFAFDMITGEKERKTLKLALSNGFGRSGFIVGKWIGGFASFILPFIVVFAASSAVLMLMPSVDLNGDQMMRLGLFLIGSVLYLSVFFSLGMLVSCLTHSSASSLVISMLLWTLIVFVVPNVGNSLMRQMVDLPSVEQLEMRRNHIWIKEIFLLITAMKEGDKSGSLDHVLHRIHDENDIIMDDYRVRFNSLVGLSKSVARISPAAVYSFFATDIAATGLNEERRLKEAVMDFRERIWDNPTDSAGNLTGDFPAFSYTRTPLSRVLGEEGLVNLAIMFLFNVVFVSGAYVSFLKYDVR